MLTVSVSEALNVAGLVVLLAMAWNQKRLSDQLDELDIAHYGLETFVIALVENLSKGGNDEDK